jgi:integrase
MNHKLRAVIKKIFKRPRTIQWQIVDKETIDEIIFRTMNIRNRIMLELMARGEKAGQLVGIELKPHDLRRHAATYASRSGTPIEIVSKVISRHADLSKTQRYLGKVNDTEAIRWIETLYG